MTEQELDKLEIELKEKLIKSSNSFGKSLFHINMTSAEINKSIDKIWEGIHEINKKNLILILKQDKINFEELKRHIDLVLNHKII